MQAKLLKVDGTEEVITPHNGSDFLLQECYEHLGCEMIEVVYLSFDHIMIVDEEGLLKPNTLNKKASEVARRIIMGDAILCLSGMLK